MLARTRVLLALIALGVGGVASPATRGGFRPGPGWIRLFNGKDLSGWKLVGRYPSTWRVVGGVLEAPSPSDNIYTERKFLDFQLHLEFKLPKGGNSGVFLRGRKEVQLYDNWGQDKLDETDCGGIFGKVAPRVNACKPPGEWNSLEVTMVGLKITVVLNGKTTVDGVEVRGATGWQLDEDEGAPGPIMLQGDHTAVAFRNIWIKPLPRKSR